MVLYHNEAQWIDENGKALPPSKAFFENKRINTTIRVSSPRCYLDSIKLFVSSRFSDSSMAFTRKLIENDIDHLSRSPLSVDFLLFDLALCSNGEIIYDNRILTYIRRHTGSVTNTPGINPKFKEAELELFSTLLKKSSYGFFDIVSYEVARIRTNLISAGYINQRAPIKDVFAVLLRFLIRPDIHCAKTFFYSSLSLIHPTFARAFYHYRNLSKFYNT